MFLAISRPPTHPHPWKISFGYHWSWSPTHPHPERYHLRNQIFGALRTVFHHIATRNNPISIYAVPMVISNIFSDFCYDDTSKSPKFPPAAEIIMISISSVQTTHPPLPLKDIIWISLALTTHPPQIISILKNAPLSRVSLAPLVLSTYACSHRCFFDAYGRRSVIRAFTLCFSQMCSYIFSFDVLMSHIDVSEYF